MIDQGIQAVQRVEEGYDLPVFVAERAEVQAALGLVQAADASFQRATDLVEGLLVNAPSSQVKSGMIGALGQIYLGHFRLAWNRMHDGPYAFSIIESARGRALLDSIRYARQFGFGATRKHQAKSRLPGFNDRLMHDISPPPNAACAGSTRRGVYAIQPCRICQAAERNGPGPTAAL